MAKKQPPHEFDPHPGDPWHPDWIAGEEELSASERDKQDGWWQRLLRRRDAAGEDAPVPEAYAALEHYSVEDHDEPRPEPAEESAIDPAPIDPQPPTSVVESVSVEAVNVTEAAVVEVELEAIELPEPAPVVESAPVAEVVELDSEPEPVLELPEPEPAPEPDRVETEPVLEVAEPEVDLAAAALPYEDFSDWLIEPQDDAPPVVVEPDRTLEVVVPTSEAPPVAPEPEAVVVSVAPTAQPTPEPVPPVLTAEPVAPSVAPEPEAGPEPVAEPVAPQAVAPAAAGGSREAGTGISADLPIGEPAVVVPPGPSLDMLWAMERDARAAGRPVVEVPPAASTAASPSAPTAPAAPAAPDEPVVAPAKPEPVPEELFQAPLPAEPAPELPPTLSPEEQAAAEAASVRRVRRQAAELKADERLAHAGAAAHEDARMWAVIADMREQQDKQRADELKAIAELEEEQRVAPEDLAEEARRIEAARASLDESRLRTEAEVRSVLQQEPGGHPGQEVIVEVAETNGDGVRFAAMAERLSKIDEAEYERLERREQLNLWTSLLLLDAEQPWDVAGWSRPGSSLSSTPAGAGSPQLLLTPQDSIATSSPAVVPESAGRRRWPWSKKQATPTAPSAPQDSLRSVVVIEERSVPDQPEDMEPEGQESFSLGDADVSPPPADVPVDGDIEDELEAWSDLDWDFTEKEEPAGAAPLEADALVEFDQPLFNSADSADPADSIDDSEESSPHDWEAFTAEEYVQTATHEYADLAAAVAASEAEAPQQAALSADMPGLESSLVSLDDVVEAEGLERADAHPGRSNLALRVITALALISLFFATLTYRFTIGLLVLVVMSIAAGELTTALVNRQFHPVALFSYLGTAGALVGAWVYGPVAIPVAVAVTLLVVVLFFGLATGRQDPLVSMALTVAVVLWVGVFGAFAYDLIPAPEYRWLIGSFVVIVALMDVAQYFVGRRFGKRPLAPTVSPKKTVAGLVGGVVAAMAVGYGLSFVAPFEATTGVVLGAALAATGPIGDLAVSVLKRSMGVKDMGTILPGHGGVVDRIDAILFSLPAAWVVYSWAGLLV